MTRLYVPRVLPAALLAIGSAFAVVAMLGLIRRLQAIVDGTVPAASSVLGIAPTVAGVLIGLMMVYAGVRWFTFAVGISADAVTARVLWRSWDLPLGQVKGIVLKQATTTPQLRIVPRRGEVIVLPGWSLRARHEDGEVEDAGAALERLGADLGFKVKVVTPLGTPPPEPSPTPRRR